MTSGSGGGNGCAGGTTCAAILRRVGDRGGLNSCGGGWTGREAVSIAAGGGLSDDRRVAQPVSLGVAAAGIRCSAVGARSDS